MAAELAVFSRWWAKRRRATSTTPDPILGFQLINSPSAIHLQSSPLDQKPRVSSDGDSAPNNNSSSGSCPARAGTDGQSKCSKLRLVVVITKDVVSAVSVLLLQRARSPIQRPAEEYYPLSSIIPAVSSVRPAITAGPDPDSRFRWSSSCASTSSTL